MLAPLEKTIVDVHVEPDQKQTKENKYTFSSAKRDGNISLPDYIFYAEETRAREQGTQTQWFSAVKSPSDYEMLNARLALRTASWASIFYLITTDIIGPFNAPFAFSQIGYVPGVILYVIMGGIACYTGLIIWRLFCYLDSDQHPVKTYADLGERIFGKWFRHTCNVLQSLQLIINVGTIILGNAQSVEQIAKNKICFSVAILIWAFVGMVIGQIRSLKQYGWLANSAVWMNLFLVFVTMGVAARSPPNYAAAKSSFGLSPGPVITAKFVSLPLFSKVNGIMQIVYAYGGAMIFPEMMAEMRRPMDFWKAMCCAQVLIVTVYMLFGIFIYAFQGQFSLPLAYQGLSIYAWQTVGNVIALLGGIIAAGLYGNIGIKVTYHEIIEGWFKGPPLISTRGRIIWTFMVLIYWSLAFVIGSAIPQVQTISGLVAAVGIMHFTYTFPPLLLVGFQMQLDARKGDKGDTWWDLSRWIRAFFYGKWYYKAFNSVLFLGSLAAAGLGMYGTGEAIRATFASGASATSFGCGVPV